jgi:hypothetical protein
MVRLTLLHHHVAAVCERDAYDHAPMACLEDHFGYASVEMVAAEPVEPVDVAGHAGSIAGDGGRGSSAGHPHAEMPVAGRRCVGLSGVKPGELSPGRLCRPWSSGFGNIPSALGNILPAFRLAARDVPVSATGTARNDRPPLRM